MRSAAPGGPERAIWGTVVRMAPDPTPPMPGDMTVPPLFGWEFLLTVVVVVAVVAAVVLVQGLLRAGGTERAEWQAWLESRSGRRPTPGRAPADDAADGATA